MEQLPLSQKLFLLNQLFTFLVQEGGERLYRIGIITDLSREHLVVKEKEGHVRIPMAKLLALDIEDGLG